MLINKSNYELFALDYIEGNLEIHEKKAMKAFLQAHPDLEAEIESMQAAMFTFEAEESIVYENKSSLLKKESETPVVFLQPRRWYQMAAAAAVAILLIGFGVGYFAGSLSSSDKDMMVKNMPIEQEEIKRITPVLEKEEEILAETTKVIDRQSLRPNSNLPESDTSKKKSRESIILEEKVIPALTTLKVENIESVKTSVKPIIEELETIEKIEATDYRAEVIAVRPLPKIEVNIVINSLQASSESTVLQNSESKELIASLTINDRLGNRLSKIKSFLGKLPFEDATLEAFVPTYLSNAD